ncbi:MAG: alpha/beta hydrolase [Patescibacteria group bacterium]|nr:alpha/beta hydrolase [Patescibacteria group bacterium]
MEFEKSIFEYAGVKTVYYTVGEGTPLLFFHGGGGWALVYKDTLEELAKDFLVVAPDLPCFGESDTPPEPWDFSDYASYFSQILKSLDLSNVLVVGHSFGGGVALHLASKSTRVKKMVLIDSLGIPLDCTFRELLVRVVQDFAKSYESVLEREQTSDLLRAWFRKNAPDIFEKMKTAKKCVESMHPDFGNFEKPTLVIWGKEDDVLPLSYGKKLAASIPTAELRVVSGKHKNCLFEPQKFASHIREFSSET